MKQASNFLIPENQIYLCGHSLGPMSKQARFSLQQAIAGWTDDIVNGWTSQQWIHLPQKLGQAIAPLVGAELDEVIVADSTSINLLKCLLTACSLNAARKIILTEHDNFPADRYIAHSLSLMYPDLQVRSIATDEIIAAMDETVAVLLLTHVNYRSSERHDIALLTRKAHELGIIVVWDLSHSIGAMPLACTQWQVDFAVGCTYKYLNGGPGSPGFIYIAKKHHHHAMPVIQGWMGHESPFSFAKDYVRAHGVKAFLTGTPPILSLKGLEGALQVFNGMDLQYVRQQSMALSQQLIESLAKSAPELNLVSPKDPEQRGSHVAYSHPNAEEITQKLLTKNVIVDYRTPALIRFGIAPLYLDVGDIQQVAHIVVEVIKSLR